MFYDRQNKAKKYSVIIIPERGSNTKKLNLSSTLIKGSLFFLAVVGVSAVVSVCFFSSRYSVLAASVKDLSSKKAYIKSLEEENKSKELQIKKYKAYQDTVNSKMKELDELEQDIKSKLDKSNLLSDSDILTGTAAEGEIGQLMPMTSIESSVTPLETIDSQIQSLSKINNQLDKLLEKEQYIPSVAPCQGRITSFFGTRSNPFDGSGEENHPAIDIANDYGTKIHVTAKGRVIYAEYKKGYGNCVCVDHGNGLVSLYGHASELLVKQGQVVEKGQTIALMGSTGRSTGPHVHFELRKDNTPINPIKILE